MKNQLVPALILAVGTSVVPVALFVSAADAASKATCGGGRWTVPQKGPDKHRAYVDCDKIDFRTKVRPKLKRDMQSDVAGTWFTRTKETHYSRFAECPFGCSGGWDWGPR